MVGVGLLGTQVAMVASAAIATLVVGELERRRVCVAVETAQGLQAQPVSNGSAEREKCGKDVKFQGKAKDLSRHFVYFFR